jgi:GxxExxY protein
MEITKTYLNKLTYNIVGAAIEVHKALGPGLLESVYQQCLSKELKLRQIRHATEFKIPYTYKGYEIDINLRCDFLIEDLLIVELKAVETVLPVHEAQLLSYMKLMCAPKGLLINFNVQNLYYDGHKSFVNQLFQYLPD